jgi:hypothetical protein
MGKYHWESSNMINSGFFLAIIDSNATRKSQVVSDLASLFSLLVNLFSLMLKKGITSPSNGTSALICDVSNCDKIVLSLYSGPVALSISNRELNIPLNT